MDTVDERQAKEDLLRFVLNEQTALTQALHMAAERCEASAKEIEAMTEETVWPGSRTAIARLMRESAASWNRKAEELDALVEAVPYEED